MGNSPIVFTVPHDGGIKIPEAKTRSEVALWEEQGHEPRDIGTLAIALACREYLAQAGITSTLLRSQLHRAHVDANRSPSNDPYVEGFEETYSSFHARIDEIITAILDRFGSCLLLDIHGYLQSPALGPEQYDIVLGSDSHQTAARGSDKKIASVLSKNYRTVFSPDKSLGISGLYRGGWIVRRTSTAFSARGLDAVQIEFNLHMRQPSILPEVAHSLALSLISCLKP